MIQKIAGRKNALNSREVALMKNIAKRILVVLVASLVWWIRPLLLTDIS